MDWLKKFMYGRYGIDRLSRELLILSFILSVIASFLPKYLFGLGIIGYILMFVCVLRIFSKNIYKRQMENYKYITIRNYVLARFNNTIIRLKALKTHKYFTCPNCKQKLRVPRGKGKISITCPKCKNSFKAKS